MMRNRLHHVAALVALFAAAPVFAATHDVVVRNFEFDPPTVVAQPGDTVHWMWESGSHTVTSGEPCTPDGLFDSPMNSSNTEFSFVVPAGGDIPYFCIPHCTAGMTGLIVVEQPAVPTLTEWGLGITAALLLAGGVLVFRRRRALAV